MSTWTTQQQKASWRGVEIGIEEIHDEISRRLAVHQYPMRDVPWIEDLGRGVEHISVRGFVGGNDQVFQQRNSLLAQCEVPGEGEFIHPTRGSIRCVLQTVSLGDRKDVGGNVVEIALNLLVLPSGGGGFGALPSVVVNATSMVGGQAASLQTLDSGNFFTSVGTWVRNTEKAITGVQNTIQGYQNQMTNVLGSATRSFNAVSGIVGGPQINLGRYMRGGVFGALNRVSQNVNQLKGGVNGALQTGANVRGLVNKGLSDLQKLGDLL